MGENRRKLMKTMRKPYEADLLDQCKFTRRERTGVPQGAPISPFIFALCVNDFFFKTIAKNGIECVAYADDAVFYGNIKGDEAILKTCPHSGLEIDIEKSG